MKKIKEEKQTWFTVDKYCQKVTMDTKSFGNSVPGNDMIKQ